MLVSESGAGKTFMLLDLAAAVSSGVAWHGRDAQQGSVAYLSYEGDALGVRLQAIRDVTGHRLDHVYGTRAQDPLSPRIDRDGEVPSLGELAATAALQALSVTLRATGRPPVSLRTIDTVRASLTGSEDSSEHVSAYLRVVRRMLTSVPGAAAILAHHAGWQDGDTQRKRERGSSAWRGNCDATFYLEVGASRSESGETELTLRTLKVRDDERPAPLRLVRRVVEVPGQMNRRGDPITSCVIERDRRTREDWEVNGSPLSMRASGSLTYWSSGPWGTTLPRPASPVCVPTSASRWRRSGGPWRASSAPQSPAGRQARPTLRAHRRRPRRSKGSRIT